jgi:hypothetical protein
VRDVDTRGICVRNHIEGYRLEVVTRHESGGSIIVALDLFLYFPPIVIALFEDIEEIALVNVEFVC